MDSTLSDNIETGGTAAVRETGQLLVPLEQLQAPLIQTLSPMHRFPRRHSLSRIQRRADAATTPPPRRAGVTAGRAIGVRPKRRADAIAARRASGTRLSTAGAMLVRPQRRAGPGAASLSGGTDCHAPQCCGVFTVWQTPSQQLRPEAQATPHAPQCCGSVTMFVQAAPQSHGRSSGQNRCLACRTGGKDRHSHRRRSWRCACGDFGTQPCSTRTPDAQTCRKAAIGGRTKRLQTPAARLGVPGTSLTARPTIRRVVLDVHTCARHSVSAASGHRSAGKRRLSLLDTHLRDRSSWSRSSGSYRCPDTHPAAWAPPRHRLSRPDRHGRNTAMTGIVSGGRRRCRHSSPSRTGRVPTPPAAGTGVPERRTHAAAAGVARRACRAAGRAMPVIAGQVRIQAASPHSVNPSGQTQVPD